MSSDWPFRATATTPLLRRLFGGSERERELRETQALYDEVRRRHAAFLKTEPLSVLIGNVMPLIRHYAPENLHGPLLEIVVETAKADAVVWELPNVVLSRFNMREFVQFRDMLRKKLYFHENEAGILKLVEEILVQTYCAVVEKLPRSETPSPFTIPLIYTLPEAREAIGYVMGFIGESKFRDRNIFDAIAHQLYRNLCSASGMEPYGERKKPFKYPVDSDLPLHELNNQYLSGTPYHRLFRLPVPLKFTHEERFNHMHVLGGTGAGKTQLLQNLILFDLQSEQRPALVIVDSQGDLIRNISHLDIFHPDHGRRRDDLLLITPKDVKFPPALNVFDLNRSRLEQYDEATKEQVIAGVIDTFDYLFSGILGADLTAKQDVFFRFVARLMLSLPETMGRNATILDLLYLLDEPEKYRDAIRTLPDIQRNFFERELLGDRKTFKETREQIRYRLNAILENPTFARLFTSPETKIDLFSELNRGAVILVDTSREFLKGASAHFGRFFISLVLQAVYERAAIAPAVRRHAFLVVDEAADYFDTKIDDLLTDARKYRLGCVFAHQYLNQASDALRASLAANTGIKFAATVSTRDARLLAPDMRTSSEFIMSQPRLHFAAHVRNVTPQAVSIPVELGKLESQPRMSEDDYRRLVDRNRERVSFGVLPTPGFGQAEEAAQGLMQKEPGRPRPADDPSSASGEW